LVPKTTATAPDLSKVGVTRGSDEGQEIVQFLVILEHIAPQLIN
jgi:hypothetical protein